MSFRLEILLHETWTLGVVIEDDKDRVREYLDGLRQNRKNEQFDVLLAALDRFCKYGPPRNEEKFRHEGDGVYAIKCQQERIYGFFHGQYFFACVVGVTKKRQKADPRLLNQVRDIKRRFEADLRARGGTR